MKVKRFINELMTSNCYIVADEEAKSCVVIDPGSRDSRREIDYIQSRGLNLDYIFVTHEHTDHNWGVNALKAQYPSARMVCSELCNKYAKKASRAYFLFYYDDPNYRYELKPADILIKTDDDTLDWNGHVLRFILTPGHSFGSMCISSGNLLFTGDTIMPFKPYFNGRDSNEDDWKKSIEKVSEIMSPETMVYPGHGESLTLGEWERLYNRTKDEE